MAATTSSNPGSTAAAIRNYLADLWDRREFAWFLALGNLHSRNASTTLGLLWWVLNPLLLGAVYGFVFGFVLQVSRGVDAYVAYLLSGMFAFYFTRSAMVGGANSIIGNRPLIINLRFPRLILPFSALIEATVGFLASLVAFYLIAGPIDGVWPTASIVWLAPAVAIHIVFNFGLAAIAARIAVPFRDVNNLLPYLLRLWLYLSPIIYTVDFVNSLGEPLTSIYRFNPLFPILAIYRSALLGYDLNPSDLLLASGWAVGIAVIAMALFVKYESRMARDL